MYNRRRFLQSASAGAVLGGLKAGGAAAQDRFDQSALLAFDYTGTVTLMHFSDLRGQLRPIYLRPAETHPDQGIVPYLSGEEFRIRYGIGGRTPMDYAHTHEDFARHARDYGKLGGVAHLGGLVSAIRQQRPQSIVLDGGDGFDPTLAPTGAMAPLHAALGTDIRHEKAASEVSYFDRAGVRIAVLVLRGGQDDLAKKLQIQVDRAREAGAGAVVCLSREGFAADRQLARQTKGLDVIFSGGGFHALPEPERVEDTRIIASGGHGCYLTRLDLWIEDGAVTASAHRLIPVFSDLIRPSPAFAVPSDTEDQAQIGRAGALLYRRGLVGSPWDDVISEALRAEHGAQITLTPGFRWGATVLAGQAVTSQALRSVTQGPPAATQVRKMTGAEIAGSLEDAAEITFTGRARFRQELDMVRAGGLGFTVRPRAARGERITDLRLSGLGPIAPETTYTVAEWGAVTGDGPPIDEVLTRYLRRNDRVSGRPGAEVKLDWTS